MKKIKGAFTIVPVDLKEHDQSIKRKIQDYNEYFNKIKDKFSSEFLKLFQENSGFHDFFITDIHYGCINVENGFVKIYLEAGNNRYILVFNTIVNVDFRIVMHDYLIHGKIELSDCWFYYNKDKFWEIKVETTGGDLFIICKEVNIINN